MLEITKRRSKHATTAGGGGGGGNQGASTLDATFVSQCHTPTTPQGSFLGEIFGFFTVCLAGGGTLLRRVGSKSPVADSRGASGMSGMDTLRRIAGVGRHKSFNYKHVDRLLLSSIRRVVDIVNCFG